MSTQAESSDLATAQAFANSWNRAGQGPVYSRQQFLEWLAPLDPHSFSGKTVIELGFGNGSHLYHMAGYAPSRLCGIELGDTIEQTRKNLEHVSTMTVELYRDDLTQVNLGEFDLAYCIGVLHHLGDPEKGFHAVLRHTRPGGHFHCWVYAHEGNALIIHVVDPIRRIACRLPWWLTKYAVALPLVTPYYAWAKLLGWHARRNSEPSRLLRRFPLYEYTLWIAERPFRFFHHVAFDQLVTPRTVYIKRSEIERWLRHPSIDPQSVYIIFRNGNSWKFGGKKQVGGKP
jgi:SAM-dependent methyltransferase